MQLVTPNQYRLVGGFPPSSAQTRLGNNQWYQAAELLNALVKEARRNNWPGDFCGGWVSWDVELIADPWHHVVIHTATEELGNGKRFTRVRWTATPTKVKRAVAACAIAWSAASVAAQLTWAMGLGGVTCGVLVMTFIRSRRRCLDAIAELIRNAAKSAGLEKNESKRTPDLARLIGTIEARHACRMDT